MMAHPGIRGYDNREIVLRYIHYKLSQKGYDWVASGDRANLPPAAAAAGTFPVLVRRASLSSEVPGLAAVTNIAPVEEVQPVPQVVHSTLRQAGDEFSRRYRRDLAQMSGQLHLTLDTARNRFATVVEELFRNGINWGRIIAFFEFGGMTCVESVSQEMSPLVDDIAAWMTEYLNRHLHDWIQDNGGWSLVVHRHYKKPGFEKIQGLFPGCNLATLDKDAFVELYSNNMRPVFDFSWLPLKTILSLAVVGACITLGAYLGHK